MSAHRERRTGIGVDAIRNPAREVRDEKQRKRDANAYDFPENCGATVQKNRALRAVRHVCRMPRGTPERKSDETEQAFSHRPSAISHQLRKRLRLSDPF